MAAQRTQNFGAISNNFAIRSREMSHQKEGERNSKHQCRPGRLKMQALSNAIPWKWRTKSQPWNLQDVENEGPNRRGWKMQDQVDFKK